MNKRKKQNITDDTNFIGAVRGVRFFAHNYGLRVPEGFRGAIWYSPRQKARCKLSRFDIAYPNNPNHPLNEPAPHFDGRCGINMFGPGSLGPNLMSHLVMGRTGIVGLTEGWGKVIEHEDGYRVEQARVMVLLVQPGSDVDVYGLDDGWGGVPIIRVEDKKEALIHIKKFFRDGQLTSIPSSEMI